MLIIAWILEHNKNNLLTSIKNNKHKINDLLKIFAKTTEIIKQSL